MKKFYFVEVSNLTIIEGPDISRNFYAGACGSISHKNGSNYAIIAGGAGNHGQAVNWVVLLDLETNIWFSGMYV